MLRRLIRGLAAAVSRPPRGTYRVHYHRFDADGRRHEGTHEVDAMNAEHAESLALNDLFGDRIGRVERIDDTMSEPNTDTTR